MNKNAFIETILRLSDLSYIIWNENNKTADAQKDIPFSMYLFMSNFYDKLIYNEILNGNSIIQVESALGVYNLLIPADCQIYVVGPYLKEKYSTANFFSCLINNNLSIEYEMNVFYQSLPIIENRKIEDICRLLKNNTGILKYEEIKQDQLAPSQEHLHSQFSLWKEAENAFSMLLLAEEELFMAFHTENFVLMHEAKENYINRLNKIQYVFEDKFLKEQLQITNGQYYRFCVVKTKKFNQMATIFYQFQIEINQIHNINFKNFKLLHERMYETYKNILLDYSYQEYPYLIRQTYHYINSHWREKISLSEIATSLSVNKCYLSTLFNEETGMKISDYIHKLKTDWAEILLQSTSLKIVDIAFLCGYEDVSYFGKVYKKQKGKTPMQTRMALQ